MRVSMLLDGSQFRLVDSLAERGIEARVVGGDRTVVYLPLAPDCTTTFRVLPEAMDGRIQLEACEHGGANGSRNATIVCGFRGRPLLPFYVARPGNCEPCGEQARFKVPEGLIVISVQQRELTITRHDLLVDRDVVNGWQLAASILSETIWKGEVRVTAWKCRSCGEYFEGRTFDVHHAKGQVGCLCWGELEVVGINLPPELDCFQDAAVAAFVKSRCPGCEHAHFVRAPQTVAPTPVVPVQSAAGRRR